MKTILQVNKRISLDETIGKVARIIEFAEMEAERLISISQEEKEILDKTSFDEGFNRGIAAGISSIHKIHSSKKILFDQLSSYICETCEKICGKALSLDCQSLIFKESITSKVKLLLSEIPSVQTNSSEQFKLIVPQNLESKISEIVANIHGIAVVASEAQNDEDIFILETPDGSFEINQYEHLSQIFSHLKESIYQDNQLTNLVNDYCENIFEVELADV